MKKLLTILAVVLIPVIAGAQAQISTKKVKIMLSQSIGAPAVACVKVGDSVKAGDVVGAFAENALSLPVHASLDGTVSEVTDKYVLIDVK